MLGFICTSPQLFISVLDIIYVSKLNVTLNNPDILDNSVTGRKYCNRTLNQNIDRKAYLNTNCFQCFELKSI